MENGFSNLSRRTFLKTGGALGALAVAGGGLAATDALFGEGVAEAHAEMQEKVTWGHCAINCPSRCPLKFHVKNDEIVWVDTDTSSDADFDDHQARACLRGRTYRRWMNSPDRLSYPLKRVGKRGEGKFERISWDEAIDTIASELKRIIDAYGNEAVYIAYATGVEGVTTGQPFQRLLNLCGGFLDSYGSYSAGQLAYMQGTIFGTAGGGSALKTAEDAELVLVFGSSPTETRQGGLHTHYDFVQLREKTKGKIILIDPRFNDSITGHSDQWPPINPGTDAALVAAIAHELIKKDLVDVDFLHKYCSGFDEESMPEELRGKHLSYKDYVLGTGYDMTEKTPEWAAPITGISPDTIRQLAQEIATASPLYVVQGWGPQRRSNGEWNFWAICLLPFLVGQVGKPGTNNGNRESRFSVPLSNFPSGKNPVKASISCFLFTDAIDHGVDMTATKDGVRGAARLSSNIKFMVNYAGNCLTNQHSDINKAHDILSDESKCEFILGFDTVMCDSAKYSDILLPDLFRSEQVSLASTGSNTAYIVTAQPCTSPKFERKTAYDVCAMLAEKLGVKDEFTQGKTQEEWIRSLYEADQEKDGKLPPYDELMKAGTYKRESPGAIAMKKFIADPEGTQIGTPSGKFEIYSQKIAEAIDTWEFAEGEIVLPIPAYIPEWHGVETVTDEHPLALMGFHYRGRIHSSWGSIDALKEVNPQEVWINPADAAARGIVSGDKVRVRNEFGEMEISAKVTPRIVPGTVAMAQGAWHDADMFGDRIDKGGCINTLTTQRPSPLSKSNPQHSNICEVAKA
ncbi:DMSO/selenate family reductase complex A subunit [Adlercreutzia sp. ZJ473]|uniref:DMSO/selenate family reductase complex A subunit n=1 Tax=Adlercreutzia sp. ZJ473 TaxID=2722822 RepID=UPI0015575F64|nr:DMSO/selenate family reductase complex A subunit [Adlercreutzia sp. ZJ473]